ncbi:ORF6N domain-containing protein [bacterium]|nr:MAG: ORF6N domain-containing protein [bacterium]
MPATKKPFANEPLEPLILSIRGHRVILDADLARLYGVSTRVLNQGVRRNSHRFPDDFAFQLTATEAANLRSQLLLPKTDAGNRSQIVTGSQKHRDPRFRPWAFTEHGALMAANVLRSRRAVQMSVYVIRAFVRLREHIAANQAILKRLAEIDKTLLQHDTALRDIYRKLLPLLQPPPEPKKRKIGFLVKERAAKYRRSEMSLRR